MLFNWQGHIPNMLHGHMHSMGMENQSFTVERWKVSMATSAYTNGTCKATLPTKIQLLRTNPENEHSCAYSTFKPPPQKMAQASHPSRVSPNVHHHVEYELIKEASIHKTFCATFKALVATCRLFFLSFPSILVILILPIQICNMSRMSHVCLARDPFKCLTLGL